MYILDTKEEDLKTRQRMGWVQPTGVGVTRDWLRGSRSLTKVSSSGLGYEKSKLGRMLLFEVPMQNSRRLVHSPKAVGNSS